MRIERSDFGSERRRRTGAFSPLFEPGRWDQGGREGLQDKSRPSWGLLTACLHVLFAGGCASRGGGYRLRLSIAVPSEGLR